MPKKLTAKITTAQDDALLLYAELNSAQTRAVQRSLKAGELTLLAKGVATTRPSTDRMAGAHRT